MDEHFDICGIWIQREGERVLCGFLSVSLLTMFDDLVSNIHVIACTSSPRRSSCPPSSPISRRRLRRCSSKDTSQSHWRGSLFVARDPSTWTLPSSLRQTSPHQRNPRSHSSRPPGLWCQDLRLLIHGCLLFRTRFCTRMIMSASCSARWCISVKSMG